MKRNRWVFVSISLVLCLSSALSCSDEPIAESTVGEESGTTSLDRELVLGEARDVEQSRGQWRHAENVSDPILAVERARRTQIVQTALASRGTGYIEGYVYAPGEDCEETGIGRGSGVLSSSTRFVTARQVAEPFDSHPGTHGTNLDVWFEATEPIAFANGQFVPDADSGGDPLWPFDRSYGYDTKFDSDEENPLLANRLASLGMEVINSGGRQELRGVWPFVVDELDFDSTFFPGRSLDVAVLRAVDRGTPPFSPIVDPTDASYLPTGAFPLDRPGVFFDYQAFQSIQHMACPDDEFEPDDCPDPLEPDTALYPAVHDEPDEEFTKLWALHHQQFPDSEESPQFDYTKSDRTNLISNPYPYIETGTSPPGEFPEKGRRHIHEPEDRPYLDGPYEYCVDEGELEQIRFGDLFDISLDAFQSSSGGGVLQRRRRFQDQSAGNVLESGILVDPIAVISAMRIEDDDYADDYDWFSEGWADPLLSPPGSDGDFPIYVVANAISDEVASWSERDRGGNDPEDDPFNPEPYQPPSDGEPNCAVHGQDGCLVYETSFAQNDAYSLPDPSTVEPFVWPDPDGDDDFDYDGAEADDESANEWRLLHCGISHPEFADSDDMRVDNTGIGLGFIGSIRYNPDYDPGDEVIDDGSPVGFLRMVCTPWSSTAFVNNWPFLQSSGTSYRRTNEEDVSIMTDRWHSFGKTLAQTLVNVAEWRHSDDNDEPYLRPLSMKTCPPNYFLKGVRFNTRPSPDNTERVVRGIQALKCVRSTEAADKYGDDTPQIVYRYLDQSPQEGSCGFQMGDRCFSRSQFIGWPRHTLDLFSLPD